MNNIEQIKNESIDEFSSIATQERYAKIAEEGFWKSEKLLIDKYFKPKSKTFDIGCGSGRTAIALAQSGYEVIGIDITPKMIETAKTIALSKNIDIDYVVGDATNLKFPENYFDGSIFANNGWVQIPGKENRQKALNEIYRVLKPGGYLILTAHQRYYSGSYFFFWIKNWVKYYTLRKIGFKIEEVDFGDLFFKRDFSDKKIKKRQFIHITSKKEVKEQIINSGFKLKFRKSMGEISNEDAKVMKGSLKKNFNSFKSPIFYVCEK